MSVIVSERSNCPYCGFLLSSDVRVNSPGTGTSIGDSTAECPKCHKLYLTGQSEWDDKNKKQRFFYYLNMWVVTILYPALTSTGIFFLFLLFLPIENSDKKFNISVIVGILWFLGMAIVLFMGFRSEIQESKLRSNDTS
jgi:hypothetical protein